MALRPAKIRVLDLIRALAEPSGTTVLGDMGAGAVEVEPTPMGEMCRDRNRD